MKRLTDSIPLRASPARCWFFGLLLAMLFLGQAGTAHAEASAAATRAACVQSYESAQEHRLASELRAALSELSRCAESACPGFIRSDCARWSAEVQREQPTLAFSIRSLGRRLDNVRISVDAVVLTERIDDRAFAFDPGRHVLTFEAEQYETRSQSVVVKRGEHGKVIAVELEPSRREVASRTLDSSATEPPRGSLEGDTPPPSRSRATVGVDPRVLALGAVGVAGVAGFATFGLIAHGDEAELRDTCSPGCSSEQVSSVKTKYALADVSLGVGVVALSWGAYLLLSAPKVSETARSKLKFDVALGSGRASAIVAGAF